MKNIFLLVIVVVVCSFAQVSKSGDLQTHIDSIISNMPQALDGDEYQHPTSGNLTTWASIIDDILATNYSTANTTAQTIDYRVTEFTDTYPNPDKIYYMLQNNPGGTNYWGTYIFDPAPDRAQLVIQIPHAIEDFNTGKQGFYVFREVGARAFFLNGTSRCNSSDTTLCDGSTSICTGSSEAYRLSDQAHTSDGTFQETTERMLIDNSSHIFIQLHGFTKQASDPYVILSNGISTDNPPIDHLAELESNLFTEDNSLSFETAHLDNWTRLIGTTNTQGRLINGSVDPCEDNASDNTGQFLHIEQEKTKLRDDASDWPNMSNAIAATFPLQALPVELTYFKGNATEEGVLLEWETATEVNNYGFQVQRQKDKVESESEWEDLGFVQGNGTTNSPKQYSFTDPLNFNLNPNLTRLDYRLKQIDHDGTFAYSKVIEVDLTTITSFDDEQMPIAYSLEQNYPNPFNPTTTIKFTVPGVEAQHAVSLRIYNILGREVTTLVNQNILPGSHEVTFDGSNLSSGVYFYRIDVNGKFSSVKKMLMVK